MADGKSQITCAAEFHREPQRRKKSYIETMSRNARADALAGQVRRMPYFAVHGAVVFVRGGVLMEHRLRNRCNSFACAEFKRTWEKILFPGNKKVRFLIFFTNEKL